MDEDIQNMVDATLAAGVDPKGGTRFSKKLYDEQARIAAIESIAMEFSGQLGKKMRLTDNDIYQASMMGMSWDIGGYVIYSERLCVEESFENLLMVVPEGITQRMICNSDPLLEDVPGWKWVLCGAQSMCLPPPHVRTEILRLMDEELRQEKR